MGDVNETSDTWQKVEIISKVLSSVFIPLVIAFVGYVYTESTKESEIRARYIEMAVEILKQNPSKESRRDPLRGWAIDVINYYSPVKMPLEVEDRLYEQRIAGEYIDMLFKLEKMSAEALKEEIERAKK